MRKNNHSLSVVIPVYNDEQVLSELIKRLVPVCIKLYNDDYEIIFIDDGSRDKSYDILVGLFQQYKEIKVLKQAKNFGQANAILAGLKFARGKYVVIMDSDLQDKPEDIPILIKEMETSASAMAIALWESRRDTPIKRLTSWMFYTFSQNVTNIKYEKGLGVFRVIERDKIINLLDVPEITGTILSLIYWSGISYVAVPLKRDKRHAGASGYSLKKMLSLTADRIFSYSLFPMKIMTNSGLLIGLGSFGVGIFTLVRKLIGASVLPGWTSIIIIVSFLFGLNFIFLGLLGEYIGRIYLETKKRPKYVTEIVLDRDER
ncbi:glycosyltransferase family 2 protein [bacterium]|nr:glycosyltransferase family 2 protein [bacterium]